MGQSDIGNAGPPAPDTARTGNPPSGVDKVNAAMWSLAHWTCLLTGLANGGMLRMLGFSYGSSETAIVAWMAVAAAIAGAVAIAATMAMCGLAGIRGSTLNAGTAAVAAISGTVVGAMAHPGLAAGATVSTTFTVALAWTTVKRRKRAAANRAS